MLDNNLFTIIGIDPGRNLGIGIITVDSRDMSITDISTYLHILPQDMYITYRLDTVYNIIKNYIIYIDTLKAIGIETAFMHRFPKAVMQLSQYIATIELSILHTNSLIKIYRLPPTLIKTKINKVLGGKSTKEDMLIGINLIKEITNKIDLSNRTEHEIDALSIAYTVLENIRVYPYYLLT